MNLKIYIKSFFNVKKFSYLSYNKKLRSIPQSIGNLDNLKEL